MHPVKCETQGIMDESMKRKVWDRTSGFSSTYFGTCHGGSMVGIIQGQLIVVIGDSHDCGGEKWDTDSNAYSNNLGINIAFELQVHFGFHVPNKWQQIEVEIGILCTFLHTK